MATSVRLDLRGDADAFEVQLDLEAREGDEPRWARSWRRRIPRQLGLTRLASGPVHCWLTSPREPVAGPQNVPAGPLKD